MTSFPVYRRPALAATLLFVQYAQKVVSGRKWLLAGASIVAIGIVLVGTVSTVTGGWITLGGWLVSAYGLHVYGRSGVG